MFVFVFFNYYLLNGNTSFYPGNTVELLLKFYLFILRRDQ